MKFKIILSLFILIGGFGCKKNKTYQLFELKDLKPVILDKKGSEVFQYWEFENKSNLWQFDPGLVTALNLYKDSLLRELGKEKLKEAIQKEARQDAKPIFNKIISNGDQINSQLVHNGSLGIIREINFLEAQLLNYQLTRYPLFSHPTEFHAFILIQDSLNLVRVYFAASDQPWPPKPAIIMQDLEKVLENGWTLKYHLHNHYEPKSNSYIGIMAPSLADAQFFKMLLENYNLEKALITNGFNTVEIKSEEFDKFESH